MPRSTLGVVSVHFKIVSIEEEIQELNRLPEGAFFVRYDLTSPLYIKIRNRTYRTLGQDFYPVLEISNEGLNYSGIAGVFRARRVHVENIYTSQNIDEIIRDLG